MFGPPGHAYVYFIYGMYYMLNLVTERDNPSAILVRGLIPVDGIETMKRLRGRDTGLTDGPGKLCMALSIDRGLNGIDVTRRGPLWAEEYRNFPEERVEATPRIGIDYAETADRDAPYRFRIAGSDE
jgi:DNA-3-methyladenine glycosylase